MTLVWSSRHQDDGTFLKNDQNAVLSHSVNGPGDPCDKWEKNRTATSTSINLAVCGYGCMKVKFFSIIFLADNRCTIL